MEEIEQYGMRNRTPVGWRNRVPGDSIRHRLAAKGIKTKNIRNARLKKAKILSDEDKLTWERFQELFGDCAEEKLENFINNRDVELEAEELDQTERLRYGQTKIEVEDNGESKTLIIDRNTQIKFLEKS